MNVLALVGNLNGAAKKSKYATEEVYRACASDNRFHSVRDPESGLTMFALKENTP